MQLEEGIHIVKVENSKIVYSKNLNHKDIQIDRNSYCNKLTIIAMWLPCCFNWYSRK